MAMFPNLFQHLPATSDFILAGPSIHRHAFRQSTVHPTEASSSLTSSSFSVENLLGLRSNEESGGSGRSSFAMVHRPAVHRPLPPCHECAAPVNAGNGFLKFGVNAILSSQSRHFQPEVTRVSTISSFVPNKPLVYESAPLQPFAKMSFLPGTPSLFPISSTAYPWTFAGGRGKPRRGMLRRAVFSDSQRKGLEKQFQISKYISKPDRKKLAEKLGLKDSQVKIWFQNRRMKWRNSKERELLSTGGSRELTLPNKSNPNPDLSNVADESGNSAIATDYSNSDRESTTSPRHAPFEDTELDYV